MIHENSRKTIQDKIAKNIASEFNAFMRETRVKVEETRRAVMLSLKQLLRLTDDDIIEIHEDDSITLISSKEINNNGK